MSIRRRDALKLGLATGVVGVVGGALPSAVPAASATPGHHLTSDAALVQSLPGFQNAYAQVNGVRLHYVIGGHGAPLVLLPGWPQTWWAFHKIMPLLAAHYRVIAVDLRGMGTSDKPQGGYDKKTMAADIRALITHLGYTQANVAGHDIGAMVAFSFAANHSAAAFKVAMLDVAHPDNGLYSLTLLPHAGQQTHFLWWFAFNQVQGLPEKLLTGRSRYLIDWKFANPGSLFNQAAVSNFDRDVYANAYSYPDAIRAGNGWYQGFVQDIIDSGTYPVVQLPILAMYGDIAVEGPPNMLVSLAGKATDVQPLEIANAGHYFPEDQPAAVAQGLQNFFG